MASEETNSFQALINIAKFYARSADWVINQQGAQYSGVKTLGDVRLMYTAVITKKAGCHLSCVVRGNEVDSKRVVKAQHQLTLPVYRGEEAAVFCNEIMEQCDTTIARKLLDILNQKPSA